MPKFRKGSSVYHATLRQVNGGKWVLETLSSKPETIAEIKGATWRSKETDFWWSFTGTPYPHNRNVYRSKTLTKEEAQSLSQIGIFDRPQKPKPKASRDPRDAMKERARSAPTASWEPADNLVGYDMVYTTVLSAAKRKGLSVDAYFRRYPRTLLIYLPRGTSPQDAILALWKLPPAYLGPGKPHKRGTLNQASGTYEVQISEEDMGGRPVSNEGIYTWKDGRMRNLLYARPSEIKRVRWSQWTPN